MTDTLASKKRREELLVEAQKFIDDNTKVISESLRPDISTVKLTLHLLTEHSPELSEQVLENPEQTIPLLE